MFCLVCDKEFDISLLGTDCDCGEHRSSYQCTRCSQYMVESKYNNDFIYCITCDKDDIVASKGPNMKPYVPEKLLFRP